MALPNNNITAGAPPLLWSNVKEALDKINDNFTALDLATGGTAVDLSILNTDVSPEYTGSYTLGSTTNRWKSGYFNVWGSSPSESVNGLWIGGAQIRGIPGVSGDPNIPGNSVIDLPLNSTIGGSLIIDPLKTFFKEIEVDNGKRIVATEYGSLLTLTSGYGISLSVTSASDEITFEFDNHVDIIGNVLAADETTVLVDSATGKLKADVGVTVDWNIDVDGNTWTFDTAGILTFPGASGSQATFGNDILQSVNNLNLQSEASVYIKTDSTGAQPIWEFGSDGTLTAPGALALEYLGALTYSLSASTAGGRITGEANKSFKIILDNGITQPEWTFGTDGNLTIPTTGNLIGNVSGNVSGSAAIFTTSLSVGSSSQAVLYTISNDAYLGNTNANSKLGLSVRDGILQTIVLEIDPLTNSINILNSYTLVGPLTGDTTGYHTGDVKGSIFGDNSTKIVDAVENKVYATFFGNITGDVTGNVSGNVTGNVSGNLTGNVTGNVSGSAGVATTVDITNTNGLTTVYYPTFVENRTTGQTVRADVDLSYRTDTNTLTVPNIVGSLTGNIFTSLIDSADSSAITVTPAVIFSSDVNVENELYIQNSRVINLTTLKSVVAASSSFADFQSRIAAL
jgi:hypothetical protein